MICRTNQNIIADVNLINLKLKYQRELLQEKSVNKTIIRAY